MKKYSLAILGSRGIPARYGGYETLIDNIVPILSKGQFSVYVYSRNYFFHRTPRFYKGASIIWLPTIRNKYLDTPFHTLLSTIHLPLVKPDIVFLVNSANSFVIPLISVYKIPVVLHVDGREYMRRKWGFVGRSIHKASVPLGCKLADKVVTDSTYNARWLEQFDVQAEVIYYGADFDYTPPGKMLASYGLKKNNYFLYVARLEPENNADFVVSAYREYRGNIPLVLVGDAPYASKYKEYVKSLADDRVLFTGAIYDRYYKELVCNALATVHAYELGGVHPAVIEAMGAGRALLLSDIPENREAAGNTAFFFKLDKIDSLSELFYKIDENRSVAEVMGQMARKRALKLFRWEKIATLYSDLFVKLCTNA